MHHDQPEPMTTELNLSGHQTDGGTVPRTPYEKPTLLVIPLVADEVLAVGCKLDGSGKGPIGASCTSSSCMAPGS